MSAAGTLSKKPFNCLGSLTKSPLFTAFTLAKGTFRRVLVCCLVVRHGTLRQNACRIKADEILPLKTFRMNMMSCCDLLAETDISLKCLSRSAYDSERDWV